MSLKYMFLKDYIFSANVGISVADSDMLWYHDDDFGGYAFPRIYAALIILVWAPNFGRF